MWLLQYSQAGAVLKQSAIKGKSELQLLAAHLLKRTSADDLGDARRGDRSDKLSMRVDGLEDVGDIVVIHNSLLIWIEYHGV
jgi:hypothetical protein